MERSLVPRDALFILGLLACAPKGRAPFALQRSRVVGTEIDAQVETATPPVRVDRCAAKFGLGDLDAGATRDAERVLTALFGTPEVRETDCLGHRVPARSDRFGQCRDERNRELALPLVESVALSDAKRFVFVTTSCETGLALQSPQGLIALLERSNGVERVVASGPYGGHEGPVVRGRVGAHAALWNGVPLLFAKTSFCDGEGPWDCERYDVWHAAGNEVKSATVSVLLRGGGGDGCNATVHATCAFRSDRVACDETWRWDAGKRCARRTKPIARTIAREYTFAGGVFVATPAIPANPSEP